MAVVINYVKVNFSFILLQFGLRFFKQIIKCCIILLFINVKGLQVCCLFKWILLLPWVIILRICVRIIYKCGFLITVHVINFHLIHFNRVLLLPLLVVSSLTVSISVILLRMRHICVCRCLCYSKWLMSWQQLLLCLQIRLRLGVLLLIVRLVVHLLGLSSSRAVKALFITVTVTAKLVWYIASLI